jgi:diguanylate cyclase (GGDEF)-like protein/putative nucleotidyltransferase with HDIG domain
LRVIAAGAGLGMGFLDTDLRFVEGNAALGEVFGVDSVIGLTPPDLGATGIQTDALVRQVLTTGRPVTICEPTARVSYYRVLDGGGAPLGISVVAVAQTSGDGRLEQLKLDAETDGLTGLVNHRVFQERLRLEVSRALRHERPLSLVMIDIDGFKQFNDTFGHQVGDDVLETVAAHLAEVVRTNDTAARLGGDEFALLLPETSADAAQVVAYRAHDAIRRDTLQPGTNLTTSIGICDLQHARNADELLRFADGALFWAKEHGRDSVCRYNPKLVEDLSVEQRSARLLRNKELAGIRSLARAIDAKDHSTLQHSERVASLAARLAEANAWTPERVNELREAALIHDVGKIGVPLEVLLKPAALTATEYEFVKSHALLGAQIASEVLNDEQTAWVRGHHENYDGTGYPDELAGDAIPIGALILGLADSWDVMTSERSYHNAMGVTEAIIECQRCSGAQFSPDIVSILTRPGFERILRIFANEQETRDRNELRFADDPSFSFTLHCECGAEDCKATVEIPAIEYRAVRESERRYIVHVGHEIPDMEETLITNEHYSIVEKS